MVLLRYIISFFSVVKRLLRFLLRLHWVQRLLGSLLVTNCTCDVSQLVQLGLGYTLSTFLLLLSNVAYCIARVLLGILVTFISNWVDL